MKKLILVMMCFIGLIQCKQKTKSEFKISAFCEKIIVQDTLDNYIAHFLISFHNPNDKDVLIFANSFKGWDDESKIYKEIGINLKRNDIATPLGQFNSSELFRIKAGESFKILYTYNELYPNKKIDFSSGKDLETKFKKVELFYKYDQVQIDDVLSKKQNQKIDYVSDISDFNVDMSKAVIEFKENLNIEEAIELIDGEIIRGK